MMIEVLLLDFDGLVCDTERAAYQSWDTFYRSKDQEFLPELWARMLGQPGGESYAVQDLERRLGRRLSHEELLERRRTKARFADSEPLRPGIRRLLSEAAGHNIRCAIVSSSGSDWVLHQLDRLDVREHFAFVVTGEQAGLPKPAPLLHLRALELLHVVPRGGIAVEDSAVGVAAAKAAGLACIAVPAQYGSRCSVAAADLVLDSLEEFTLANAVTNGIGT